MEKHNTLIAFRIDGKYHEKLHQMAKSSGTTVSDILREIVHELLTEPENENYAQRFQPALFWTKRFGEILKEAQRRLILIQQEVNKIRDEGRGT